MLLFAVLLPLLSTTLGAMINERQYTQCYDGVNILALPYHGGSSPGIQNSLISKIQQAIPNSNYQLVQYDSYNSNFSVGIADGVAKSKAVIKQYNRECPGHPIVITGWSEGGIVLMNLLCDGLPDKFKPNIISAIAYGEETFVPNRSYNKGTCVTAPSEHPRTDPDACNLWKNSIRDYCEAGDAFCCGDQDQGLHAVYAKYDDEATNFTVMRYNKSKKRGDF